MKVIAQWQSKGGRYIATLYKAEGSGYYYRGEGCSGYFGNDITEERAIALMEERCAIGAGYFQPDNNKSAMVRCGVQS